MPYKKNKSSSLTYLEKQQWAILEPALVEVLDKAHENIEAFFDVGDDVAAPYKNVDGTAFINVEGTIFGRSNILTMLGMGTSVESLEKQYTKALADPDVKEIKFLFATPGGVFDASKKFADKIYAHRGEKPVTSLVTGLCASAGYLIASATDSIESNDEANLIGGLGIIFSILKNDDEERIFVSSNAPKKNPDPDSRYGMAVYQDIADKLEAVMLEKIARNRNVTINYIKKNFGEGSVLLARDAINVKMIDKIIDNNGGNNMDKKILMEQYKEVYDEIVAESIAPKDAKIKELEASVAALTTAKAELEAKVAELMQKLDPGPQLPAEAKAKIDNLEMNLLESKLTGCVEEVKNALMKLRGKVQIDEIVAIGKMFTEMQNKINAIGKPIGNSSDDDSIKAKINAKVAEYEKAGMSKTEAYTHAYKELIN